MKLFYVFFTIVFSFLNLTLGTAYKNDLKKDLYNVKQGRVLISNDFENGVITPWYDESPGNVKWKVEDFNSPTEVDSPAPSPVMGTKYLRATRNAALSSGLAVLRSEVFMASPGDRITFSFWIRSKFTEGNTLELYWTIGRNETLLIGVSRYSTAFNFEWRTVTVSIPVTGPTEIGLVFYGYCGFNVEDAIAIDDIVVDSEGTPNSSSSPETTQQTTPGASSTIQATTTLPTTTTFPTVPVETTYASTASTGFTTTTNNAITTNPSGTMQRTVVFIKKVTNPGEVLFIRGGISNEQNPACIGDTDATSACAIPINVMSLGETAYYEKYNAWRVGDTRLDWFGAQAGQGSYGTTPASGTPLEWTSNDYFHPGFQPLNRYDDHMWMVDMDMDCSKGIGGWFEFRAFFQNNWEGNINQVPCTGPATARPPFVSSTNHHGRCGFINVFTFGNSSCYIDYFPTA